MQDSLEAGDHLVEGLDGGGHRLAPLAGAAAGFGFEPLAKFAPQGAGAHAGAGKIGAPAVRADPQPLR